MIMHDSTMIERAIENELKMEDGKHAKSVDSLLKMIHEGAQVFVWPAAVMGLSIYERFRENGFEKIQLLDKNLSESSIQCPLSHLEGLKEKCELCRGCALLSAMTTDNIDNHRECLYKRLDKRGECGTPAKDER